MKKEEKLIQIRFTLREAIATLEDTKAKLWRILREIDKMVEQNEIS